MVCGGGSGGGRVLSTLLLKAGASWSDPFSLLLKGEGWRVNSFTTLLQSLWLKLFLEGMVSEQHFHTAVSALGTLTSWTVS